MGAAKVKAKRRAALAAWNAGAETDRLWFAAHPGRSTYIRLATPGEIEHKRLTGTHVPPIGPAVRWFCIVRQNTTGMRQRFIVSWFAGAPLDVPEETAADVYRRFRSPADAVHDDSLRQGVTACGRSVH